MGRSRTPALVIELEGPVHVTPIEWKSRDYGRPTTANLERVIEKYNGSYAEGGCNAHIGERAAHTGARIVRNAGPRAGEVVAEWNWEETC